MGQRAPGWGCGSRLWGRGTRCGAEGAGVGLREPAVGRGGGADPAIGHWGGGTGSGRSAGTHRSLRSARPPSPPGAYPSPTSALIGPQRAGQSAGSVLPAGRSPDGESRPLAPTAEWAGGGKQRATPLSPPSSPALPDRACAMPLSGDDGAVRMRGAGESVRGGGGGRPSRGTCVYTRVCTWVHTRGEGGPPCPVLHVAGRVQAGGGRGQSRIRNRRSSRPLPVPPRAALAVCPPYAICVAPPTSLRR